MDWSHLQIVFSTIATIAIFLSLVWAVKKRSRDYVVLTECEKMRDSCMKEKAEMKIDRNIVGKLESITGQIALDLREFKDDRIKLFDDVRRAFSILGDQAMAVQILSAKVLKDEPDTMTVVLDLLRKGK